MCNWMRPWEDRRSSSPSVKLHFSFGSIAAAALHNAALALPFGQQPPPPAQQVPLAPVLQGTVGIGGSYMCIYPMDSPGGYQLVGRTLPIWNTFGRTKAFTAEKPWLLEFFDQVC